MTDAERRRSNKFSDAVSEIVDDYLNQGTKAETIQEAMRYLVDRIPERQNELEASR